MRARIGRIAWALAAAVVLAGCAGPPEGLRATPEPAPPSAAAAASGLVTARQRAGIADCPSPTARPAVDGGLPDLTLACLGSDRTVNLAALRGRPLVVNLWAQWCEPCRAEAPALRAVAAVAGDRVRFLGIDYTDPRPDLAIEFAASVGWRYPHVVDPDRLTQAGLKVPGIPLTLFVDSSGRIVHRHVGPLASGNELARLVKVYLGVSL